MNGLESAIRNALERAGRPNAEERGRIYDSARLAVEKSLRKSGTTDPETLGAQRARVDAVIARIESEFDQAPQDRAPDIQAEGPLAPQDAGNAGGLHETPASSVTPAQADRPIGERPSAEVKNLSDYRAPSLDTAAVAPPVSEPAISGEHREGASLDAGAGERLAPRATPPTPRKAEKSAGLAAAPGKRSWFALGSRKVRSPKAANEARPRKRRGGIASLLIQLGVLFTIVAVGLWWISANGGVEELGQRLADSGAEMLNDVENNGSTPAGRVGAGQFSGDWVPLFGPDDFDNVSTGSSVSVETVERDDAEALRIVSLSAQEPGEVRIPLDFPENGAFAPGRLVLALSVRTVDDDAATQIYVRCAIEAASDCQRQRFDVNFERSDLLFDAEFASRPGSEAELIVNSDIAGQGKGIDLFEIRMQPAS